MNNINNSPNQRYAAIIGDIVNSRKIENRNEIQKRLKNLLDDINKKYHEYIASKFIITLGDEFQGLLKNPDKAIEIISYIEIGLLSVEVRFGIGIGAISTDINYENSSEVDGPAYHRAREMISRIECIEKQYTERISNVMISSTDDKHQSKNYCIDELLNSILSVCTALKSKWTERQKEIILTYLSNGQNQYKTANALSIGQSSVNKALKSAKYYTYKYAMETIEKYLSKFGRENYV